MALSFRHEWSRRGGSLQYASAQFSNQRWCTLPGRIAWSHSKYHPANDAYRREQHMQLSTRRFPFSTFIGGSFAFCSLSHVISLSLRSSATSLASTYWQNSPFSSSPVLSSSSRVPAGSSTDVYSKALRSTSNDASYADQYQKLRESEFAAYRAEHPEFTPYFVHPFRPSMTIPQFTAAYGSLPDGSRESGSSEILLTGRIVRKRDSSSKLIFYDIVGCNTEGSSSYPTVQIMCSQHWYKGDFALNAIIRKGDIIGLRGFPGKSKKGELSMIPTEIVLLSPSLHIVPQALVDPDVRYRQRYLDFLVYPKHKNAFFVRAKVVSAIRQFLLKKQFLEVETPVIWTQPGGANARPFLTTSHALGQDLPLSMRVAPELFLKQLVIGGINKVFEIGKVFRNEGIDATHNPEFTTCEFYQAFANYEDMMILTEELLREMALSVHGQLQVPFCIRGHSSTASSNGFPVDDIPAPPISPSSPPPPIASADRSAALIIDFSTPFQRLDVIETIESRSKRKLPNNYNDPSSISALLSLCSDLGIKVAPPHTNSRIMDKLIGEYVEPLCQQPTFVFHHPICLSPLAKRHPTRPDVTERFELFIGGKEFANAYSELNDPVDQRERLLNQQKMKDQGDDEACPSDESFCHALEYGLPPTAGWGMGIDRLVMLFSGSEHIRDVVLFPIMKPKEGKDTSGQEPQ